jgi:hypothetical protein
MKNSFNLFTVGNYMNKQDGDQLILEQRMDDMVKNATPQLRHVIEKQRNRLYLSILSEATKRFDTHEINRILNIYQSPNNSFSTTGSVF